MKLRWREILIALIMAVTLWYGMSGSEKVESQVEVRVDYKGIPQGLVVRSGMVNKLSVRVRASVGLLRSLGNKEYPFSMDLSSLRKGENTLPIDYSKLPFWGAIEVIETIPSHIQLEVDTLETKRVPLEAEVQGDLNADYVVQAVFTPAEVALTGASSVIAEIQRILVPVQVDQTTPPGVTEAKRVLSLPAGIDATPNSVSVGVHVGIRRKLLKVTRPVEIDTPPAFGRYLRPDKVTISVAVPESQTSKAAGHPTIAAFAVLENSGLGTYSLPVRVRLPEGMELVGVEPARVTVTLEQKNQAAPKPKPKPKPAAQQPKKK